MDQLELKLTSGLIDNFATPQDKTVIDLSIKRDKGRIYLENKKGIARSEHLFKVSAKELNCPPYDKNQSFKLFILALSLYDSRLFFSPSQPGIFSPNLKLGKIPSIVEESDTPTGKKISISETIRITESILTVMSSKYELEESKIFTLVDILLSFDPFNYNSRTNFELNILDSLKRYLEALSSGSPLDFYKSFYFSLEKAVNAYDDKKKTEFDKEASSLTGINQDIIKELRSFINRVKHRIRNDQDFEKLKTGESNLGELSKNLKYVTDNAILKRLKKP